MHQHEQQHEQQQQQQQHQNIAEKESIILNLFYKLFYYGLICTIEISAIFKFISSYITKVLTYVYFYQKSNNPNKCSINLPSHIAISCPIISNCQQRRNCIASIISFLFSNGVSNISLYDPVNPIHVSTILSDINEQFNSSSSSSSSSSLSSLTTTTITSDLDDSDSEDSEDSITSSYFNVSHIGKHDTYKSTISFPLIFTKSETESKRTRTECKQETNDIDTDDTLMWGGSLTSSTKNNECKDSTTIHQEKQPFNLTFINPKTGRNCIVRAARNLAHHRIQNHQNHQLSIDQVRKYLDNDPISTNLPSEPDILIVFPMPDSPSIPILHEFPLWQLRLTQINFCPTDPQSLTYNSLIRMLSSAARTPKRFGR